MRCSSLISIYFEPCISLINSKAKSIYLALLGFIKRFYCTEFQYKVWYNINRFRLYNFSQSYMRSSPYFPIAVEEDSSRKFTFRNNVVNAGFGNMITIKGMPGLCTKSELEINITHPRTYFSQFMILRATIIFLASNWWVFYTTSAEEFWELLKV